MTAVFVNPGSGPVADATFSNARKNMRRLVKDTGGQSFYSLGTGHDGRFDFALIRDGRTFEIQMPGIPLDQVRYVEPGVQNIWHFPRLYVDGSSWVWIYAVGIITRSEDDE